MKWYLEVLKKYAVFSGRAPRKEYWIFVLVNCIIALLISVIGKAMGAGTVMSSIYTLALLIPGTAVAVRRMHDTGRSGWWILIPLVNLVFLCMDSQPGDNQFGSNRVMA